MKFTKFLLILSIMTVGVYVYSLFKNTKVKTTTTKIEKVKTIDVLGLKKDIQSTMLSLLATLKSINDIDSAKRSVKTLTKINNSLIKYEPMMYEASTMDRMQIKQYVSDFIPHLKDPLKKLRDKNEVVKIIDPIIKKLENTLILYKMF